MKRKAKFRVGQVVAKKGVDYRPFKIAELAQHGFDSFKYRGWFTDDWQVERDLRPLTKREVGPDQWRGKDRVEWRDSSQPTVYLKCDGCRRGKERGR